ncbi:MAG: RNA polymerase sigma factor [Acidimicrobiales bacterium]
MGDDPARPDGCAAKDDAALLAAVAAGDRGAPLEELFRRYAGRLYALGTNLLGDAGLAEELVQESFVRLWRQAPRFDPARGTVAAFVFVLARRIAVDLWRRPSSRPLTPDPAANGWARWFDDPAPEVVDGMVVRHALDSLSPAHRQVIELSYGGGLTQAEIARRVGVPLGTVKTRTYHALRALKVALEAQGVDA